MSLYNDARVSFEVEAEKTFDAQGWKPLCDRLPEWSLPSLKSAFEGPMVVGFGAREGRRGLIGGALCRLGPDMDLLFISVLKEVEGQGVGAALLDQVLIHALEQSRSNLFLEVRVGNVRAQRLYLSRGFRPIGKRMGYYRSVGNLPTEDAWVMKRVLKESFDRTPLDSHPVLH